MAIQALGILALVVGVTLEIFGVGSDESLGMIVALIGIGLFVYGLVQTQRGRR